MANATFQDYLDRVLKSSSAGPPPPQRNMMPGQAYTPGLGGNKRTTTAPMADTYTTQNKVGNGGVYGGSATDNYKATSYSGVQNQAFNDGGDGGDGGGDPSVLDRIRDWVSGRRRDGSGGQAGDLIFRGGFEQNFPDFGGGAGGNALNPNFGGTGDPEPTIVPPSGTTPPDGTTPPEGTTPPPEGTTPPPEGTTPPPADFVGRPDMADPNADVGTEEWGWAQVARNKDRSWANPLLPFDQIIDYNGSVPGVALYHLNQAYSTMIQYVTSQGWSNELVGEMQARARDQARAWQNEFMARYKVNFTDVQSVNPGGDDGGEPPPDNEHDTGQTGGGPPDFVSAPPPPPDYEGGTPPPDYEGGTPSARDDQWAGLLEQVLAQYENGRATTRGVSPEETVRRQIEDLLRSDSRYVQEARERGRQAAFGRGLGNSNLAAGSAELSAIQSALPIASQDAATYARTASENMAAQNQELFTRLQTGAQLMAQGMGNDAAWDRAVLAADTALKTTKIDAATRVRVANISAAASKYSADLDYQANLDRIVASFDIQQNDFEFQAAENAANRQLQTNIQQNDFLFRAEEGRLNRQLEVLLADERISSQERLGVAGIVGQINSQRLQDIAAINSIPDITSAQRAQMISDINTAADDAISDSLALMGIDVDFGDGG